jgi:DNA-binding PadR family transcriptional regulator
VATEQEGGRPSRTVYAITEEGRKAFLGLLREVWQDVERHYFTFDVGLTYMQALPREEAKGYLRQRIATLEGILRRVEAHREEQLALEEVPRVAAAVFDHGLAHYEAELAWTRDLLEKVEQGVYP